MGVPLDIPGFDPPKNALFTEVFDQMLQTPSRDLASTGRMTKDDMLRVFIEHTRQKVAFSCLVDHVRSWIDSVPEDRLPELITELSKAGYQLVDKVGVDTWNNVLERRVRTELLKQLDQVVPPVETGTELNLLSKATLDSAPNLIQSGGVQNIRSLAELISALRSLTREHGAKSELARYVGVSRQAVDQWLREDERRTDPTAEIAFRLLQWVRLREVNQQKTPGRVTSTAQGPDPKELHEKTNRPKSGPSKR